MLFKGQYYMSSLKLSQILYKFVMQLFFGQIEYTDKSIDIWIEPYPVTNY